MHEYPYPQACMINGWITSIAQDNKAIFLSCSFQKYYFIMKFTLKIGAQDDSRLHNFISNYLQVSNELKVLLSYSGFKIAAGTLATLAGDFSPKK